MESDDKSWGGGGREAEESCGEEGAREGGPARRRSGAVEEAASEGEAGDSGHSHARGSFFDRQRDRNDKREHRSTLEAQTSFGGELDLVETYALDPRSATSAEASLSSFDSGRESHRRRRATLSSLISTRPLSSSTPPLSPFLDPRPPSPLLPNPPRRPTLPFLLLLPPAHPLHPLNSHSSSYSPSLPPRNGRRSDLASHPHGRRYGRPPTAELGAPPRRERLPFRWEMRHEPSQPHSDDLFSRERRGELEQREERTEDPLGLRRGSGDANLVRGTLPCYERDVPA